MAKIRNTQIRAFFAAIFTLGLLIVFGAFVAVSMDVRIPILRNITDALGF